MIDVDRVSETVRAAWCEVLETRQAEPDDDFFRSGGNSMLAMFLVGRVQHELGVKLQANVVFDHRTLRAFTRRAWDQVVSERDDGVAQ